MKVRPTARVTRVPLFLSGTHGRVKDKNFRPLNYFIFWSFIDRCFIDNWILKQKFTRSFFWYCYNPWLFFGGLLRLTKIVIESIFFSCHFLAPEYCDVRGSPFAVPNNTTRRCICKVRLINILMGQFWSLKHKKKTIVGTGY